MTVEELINILTEIEDKQKIVAVTQPYGMGFIDVNVNSVKVYDLWVQINV